MQSEPMLFGPNDIRYIPLKICPIRVIVTETLGPRPAKRSLNFETFVWFKIADMSKC